MHSVATTDHVEDSEHTAIVLDPDLPNAATNTGKRSAMQRLVAWLQLIKFTAYDDTDCSRECPDDL
jgi:hypothetical protein